MLGTSAADIGYRRGAIAFWTWIEPK